MTPKQQFAAALVFEKLGHMLASGVPMLAALDAAMYESAQGLLKQELRRIHRQVRLRKEPLDAWAFLPQSAQLIWSLGVKNDLGACCLRIAALLRADAAER